MFCCDIIIKDYDGNKISITWPNCEYIPTPAMIKDKFGNCILDCSSFVVGEAVNAVTYYSAFQEEESDFPDEQIDYCSGFYVYSNYFNRDNLIKFECYSNCWRKCFYLKDDYVKDFDLYHALELITEPETEMFGFSNFDNEILYFGSTRSDYCKYFENRDYERMTLRKPNNDRYFIYAPHFQLLDIALVDSDESKGIYIEDKDGFIVAYTSRDGRATDIGRGEE